MHEEFLLEVAGHGLVSLGLRLPSVLSLEDMAPSQSR